MSERYLRGERGSIPERRGSAVAASERRREGKQRSASLRERSGAGGEEFDGGEGWRDLGFTTRVGGEGWGKGN
jgi:hypothetical protein